MALGEAAELEEDFNSARHLYASALSAVDPRRDERMYARAAIRTLLNASTLGDRRSLADVASFVERLPRKEVTARLHGIGALARGLERSVKGDWTAARRSFEAAMSAAWESHDHESEAVAHHLLARSWSRLGKMARVRDHVEAARAAAIKSGSWLLERRLSLEHILHRLSVRPTPEAVAEARKYVTHVRKLGFPKLESAARSKLAASVLSTPEVSEKSADARLARELAALARGRR